MCRALRRAQHPQTFAVPVPGPPQIARACRKPFNIAELISASCDAISRSVMRQRAAENEKRPTAPRGQRSHRSARAAGQDPGGHLRASTP